MKYVALGLILIVVGLGRVGTRAPADLPTRALASLRSVSSGIRSTVEIDVKDTPDGTRIALAIHQEEHTCDRVGTCHEQLLLAGLTWQDVGPNDARVDRIRGRAFVHATIGFQDDITQTEIPVHIDAIWTDTGEPACNPQIVTAISNTVECVRTARVIADVAIGATSLIANQTVTDGRLVWQVSGA